MMRSVSVVLLHYPVRDRAGATITTAVTNLDLHDMSRSARSYGLKAMHVVHPIAAQRELILRVRDHWLCGSGGRRIPDRTAAIQLLNVVPSLQALWTDGESRRSDFELWTTSAQQRSGILSYGEARSRIHSPGRPVMLLFGTGWGLASEIEDDADVRLEPISAAQETGFNHLSVRAACAISLDRLLGAR